MGKIKEREEVNVRLKKDDKKIVTLKFNEQVQVTQIKRRTNYFFTPI